jgi:murein DD-endopeptidase MepM/ murein hydrolase activator NlpD
MPVESSSEYGEYADTMVFNQTLNRFESHKAIDFFAEEGAPVVAVYDGTVESVTNTLLHGTTIIIDHGNGLKSIYNSLADGDGVVAGQTVSQGDVIGEVSSTNRQEYKDGPHLHFAVQENGEIIDPAKYLTFSEK